ncbi:MAG: peptidoglycan DD-metalloendopeptidase family protein [Lachnoclostridium sp.]|nr:peptidoglycan DD-metalloendopeptidase family protein [Lachnoclostridium sp.]
MKFRLRRFVALALAIIIAIAFADPAMAQRKRKSSKSKPKSDIESVTSEKRRHEQEMANTSRRIESNKAEISRQLANLNTLNAEIEENTKSLSRLSLLNDSIQQLIAVTEDSVELCNSQLASLRESYIKALRQLQPYDKSSSALAFIFSADDFSSLTQRIRYIRHFSKWRKKRSEEIEVLTAHLAEKRKSLKSLQDKSSALLARTSDEQNRLNSNRKKTENIVTSLKRDEKSLRSVLEQHRRQAKALDAKLERLIAEEQQRIAREEAARKEAARKEAEKKKTEKKPTETKSEKSAPAAKPSPKSEPLVAEASTSIEKLTGTFAANKGKLPFPVAGKYKIVSRFGRQPHPSLPKVEIENSGIDIQTDSGAKARAIFDGKISAIFKEDGYNSIVMVRHGKYITIYAGIDHLAVKTGDNVKAGQTIGTVNNDAAKGVPILHFEIRNEKTKLNPTAWLK